MKTFVNPDSAAEIWAYVVGKTPFPIIGIATDINDEGESPADFFHRSRQEKWENVNGWTKLGFADSTWQK